MAWHSFSRAGLMTMSGAIEVDLLPHVSPRSPLALPAQYHLEASRYGAILYQPHGDVKRGLTAPTCAHHGRSFSFDKRLRAGNNLTR